MKYLTIALLLLSTAAYAEDAKPEAATGAPAAVASPPAPTVNASTAPAPTPVQPSVWMVENLDKRDLADIQNGLGKCPKDVADPLIALFNSKIKVQK